MRFAGVTAALTGFFALATFNVLAQTAPAHYGSNDLPAVIDPPNTVVLIFNHGSIVDRQIDHCDMKKLNDSAGVPYIIHEFHGTVVSGKTIFVDGFCSQQLGEYDADKRTGEPKVMKRSRAIESRARAYTAVGVPPKQIFLVGQSAGGWASLLVKARASDAANAAIAFAPAFAGRWRGRNASWQWLRDEQVKLLTEAKEIPALVFSMQNDEYELPEHVAFMDRIPGLERQVLSDLKIDNVACDSKTSSHALFRNVCFYMTQGPRLKAYIEKRLAVAN